MTIVLKPIEILWRGVNRLRRALYGAGILKSKRLPRPVISVGNLAAGGSGKTPAVIAIARYLTARGFAVAILTRGYGRMAGPSGLVTSLDADRFGDEPVLIKRSIIGSYVIVGQKRHDNAVHFMHDKDCDVFLLDDGFQHLQLARDLDVVIDAGRGVMREGRSALAHAEIVIPRNLRLVIPEDLRQVRQPDSSGGRRIECAPSVRPPLFAFSGLADNEQFFSSLRANGLNVVGTRGFRDHHRYTAADLTAVKEAARVAGAEVIVTTEKDAVKIDDHDIIAVAAEMIIEPAVLEAIAAKIGGSGSRRLVN